MKAKSKAIGLILSLAVMLSCQLTAVQGHEIVEGPIEDQRYYQDCMNCIMAGRWYCRSTEKCWISGPINGKKDCRFPEKVYDLLFEDVEKENKFINNVFNCS